MMKKNMWLVAVVVVIVLAVGGYFIFHKSPKTPAATSSTSSSTTSKTASTSSNTILQTKSNSALGAYLANSSGKALYIYSGDTQGKSNCNGSCIYSWPPYQPSSSSSSSLPQNLTIISRSDSSKQYAYKGLPLYTFSSDSSGQVTGNGVSGFSIAKP